MLTAPVCLRELPYAYGVSTPPICLRELSVYIWGILTSHMLMRTKSFESICILGTKQVCTYFLVPCVRLCTISSGCAPYLTRPPCAQTSRRPALKEVVKTGYFYLEGVSKNKCPGHFVPRGSKCRQNVKLLFVGHFDIM